MLDRVSAPLEGLLRIAIDGAAEARRAREHGEVSWGSRPHVLRGSGEERIS